MMDYVRCFDALQRDPFFSIMVLFRQGQHLGSFRLSEDHKPGRPDEQQRIEGNGGVVDMQAWLG